ncbi:IS30 family transposase [Enterococcus faecium]
MVLPDEQQEYIQKKVVQGWAPDVLIGRAEFPIACSVRTLYRMFKDKTFDTHDLPMKGKKKNQTVIKKKEENKGFAGQSETERQTIPSLIMNLVTWKVTLSWVENKKSAVITLVERLSKVIITLKPEGRQAKDIENRLNQWFRCVPKNLFKSITFDCGKEFSNWKKISNTNDISIYFADPGTPSQRGLNEHSNGLLRKDGLYKAMDFNGVSETFIQSVASKRNHIPRKSLHYRTPMEVFLSYVTKDDLSNLI